MSAYLRCVRRSEPGIRDGAAHEESALVRQVFFFRVLKHKFRRSGELGWLVGDCGRGRHFEGGNDRSRWTERQSGAIRTWRGASTAPASSARHVHGFERAGRGPGAPAAPRRRHLQRSAPAPCTRDVQRLPSTPSPSARWLWLPQPWWWQKWWHGWCFVFFFFTCVCFFFFLLVVCVCVCLCVCVRLFVCSFCLFVCLFVCSFV